MDRFANTEDCIVQVNVEVIKKGKMFKFADYEHMFGPLEDHSDDLELKECKIGCDSIATEDIIMFDFRAVSDSLVDGLNNVFDSEAENGGIDSIFKADDVKELCKIANDIVFDTPYDWKIGSFLIIMSFRYEYYEDILNGGTDCDMYIKWKHVNMRQLESILLNNEKEEA